MESITIASDVEVINGETSVVVKAAVYDPHSRAPIKEFKAHEPLTSVAIGEQPDEETAMAVLANHLEALKTKAAYRLMDHLLAGGYL